jgi:hypothetical protein
MANIRKTAMGNAIDIDRLRLANETTIAVGNTKTNARGDQLGPGGKIIKTRAQIMAEYHQMGAELADHSGGVDLDESEIQADTTTITQPASVPTQIVNASPAAPAVPAPGVDQDLKPAGVDIAPLSKPRGSFADAIAQSAEVTQELSQPIGLQNGRPQGPQRL